MTFYGAYEPAGLIYLARGISQGELKWSEDLAKILYACTLCGYCEDLCQRGIRYTPAVAIIEELRRIVPDGLKPKSLKKAAETVKIPQKHKLAMLKQFGIRDINEDSKTATIFFPDSTLLLNTPKLNEIGYTLQKSGLKIVCFCHEPLPLVSPALLNAGLQEELERCIAEIDKRLSKRRIKKVIVYNPESLSVLKRFSRSGAEFLSITRVYADMLRRKKAKQVKLPAVTYQDPCHLGRYAKEYAAPREVITALGLNLNDMWRSGDNALCCGAGGGVLIDNPALARVYAANRWQEAKATEAKVMITACPNCYVNLQRSKPKYFQVIDMTALVAQAYGYRGKEVSK
jgi:Fe-S oxidoreductase